MRAILLTFVQMLWVSASAAAPAGATATGTVHDEAGQPLQHATVIVYSAGVRVGYSQFCPTCYVDCGRRTFTDASGRFVIEGLADDLVFTLLAVKDGYTPAWISGVDPLRGVAPTVKMSIRQPVEDLRRVLRGKVVDASGDPVPDAVIEGESATYRGPGGQVGKAYGAAGWSEVFAVSNEKGEFELVYGSPALKLDIRVSSRGMAPALFSGTVGADRKIIRLTEGVVLRGRLMKEGKPVPGVLMGLRTVNRSNGVAYPEALIGTDADGRFAFTNVPPGRAWNVYPKLDSLAGRGGVEPVQCFSPAEGRELDLGDLRMKPGYTFSGRVVLGDGKPLAEGMRVTISPDRGLDTQTIPLSSDGRFRITGLLPGAYLLSAAVRDYKLPDGVVLEAIIKGDVSDYVIPMEPAPAGVP